jgi:hypothetical protein
MYLSRMKVILILINRLEDFLPIDFGSIYNIQRLKKWSRRCCQLSLANWNQHSIIEELYNTSMGDYG